MSEPIVMPNEGSECTEFTVRWTMELGRPTFGLWSSRASALEQLKEPRAGAVSGELVQRTVTISPWTVVPDVAAVQGLFAQPEHDYSVFAGFPPELVKDTSHHNGLRYQYIGEEEERLVILGHPTRAELDALPSWIGFEPAGEPEEAYARLLTKCPKHKKKSPKKSCRVCRELEPGSWWLDWSHGKKKGPKANAGKAGYFPITVWEVYG